jgi:sec-independent protein translocase protein TatA
MGPEWWIVGGVILLLFGGSQLPKLARSLGQAQNEFKAGLSEGAKEQAAKDASDASGDAAKN